MKNKKIVIVLILAILAGLGWLVMNMKKSTVPTPSTDTTYIPVDEKAALTQMQGDMQNVSPHFIVPTWKQGQTLTAEEKSIETDLGTLLTAQNTTANPNNPVFRFMPGNDFWLNAIGKRYILIGQAGADSAFDAILDSQTGEITTISKTLRYYLAPERDIVLYIDKQSLYTYSLNQATTTLVVGSHLSGTETYHNGYIGGIGIEINPQETHTKNSITISIFDSSKSVPNPDVPGATMYAKAGQKTLSF